MAPQVKDWDWLAPRLQLLMEDWQQRLRLRDWHLQVSFVFANEFSDNMTHGDCVVLDEKLAAWIRILHPQASSGDWWPLYDAEVTLVHELLHCWFKQFEAADGTVEGKAQERAIDALATAFVALKRSVPDGTT